MNDRDYQRLSKEVTDASGSCLAIAMAVRFDLPHRARERLASARDSLSRAEAMLDTLSTGNPILNGSKPRGDKALLHAISTAGTAAAAQDAPGGGDYPEPRYVDGVNVLHPLNRGQDPHPDDGEGVPVTNEDQT